MSEMIIYYSRAGQNYVSGEIKDLSIGNTEFVARLLQKYTKAGLFKLEPRNPYPHDYSDCINMAKSDQRNGIRPVLTCFPANLDKVDTIYLGYPNYWGTCPMPVFTFLEHANLDGKKLYLFCTHEGDGFGRSAEDIVNLLSNNYIYKGLAIRGAGLADAEQKIKEWLKNKSK